MVYASVIIMYSEITLSWYDNFGGSKLIVLISVIGDSGLGGSGLRATFSDRLHFQRAKLLASLT